MKRNETVSNFDFNKLKESNFNSDFYKELSRNQNHITLFASAIGGKEEKNLEDKRTENKFSIFAQILK